MMFLKLKKYDITTKGRVFPDEKKHHNWLSKNDTSYPKVYTNGLLLACMIDAVEFLDVETAGITGSFLKTSYDKRDIHIKTEEAMVILIDKIDPAYYK